MFLLLTVLILIIYDSYTTRWKTWKIATAIATVYILTGMGSLAGLWYFNVVALPPH